MKIRNLTADEIECRVQTVKKTPKPYCILLLYKNARCDMKILDETFGTFRWQRKHYECKNNLFCSVGIKTESEEWVWKDDCGAESYTEKEKGEASDSFKRACFNWGIGRELYTAPFIYVQLDENEFDKDDKLKTRFNVKSITISDEKTITSLEITDNNNKARFVFDENKKPVKEQKKPKPSNKISHEQAKEIGNLAVKKFGKENASEQFTVATGYKSLTDVLLKDFETVKSKLE